MQEAEKTTILITGGSGLIGRYLTSALLEEGYNVSHLSRGPAQFGRVRVYRWNPGKKILDPDVVEQADYVIHLAGANLGEGRWTETRKKEIISSRVDSANLIFETVSANNIKLKGFISASGVNYYGTETSERILTEEDMPANDFLGLTCQKWEEAADRFSGAGIRTVKIRTAMVLEKSESALSKLLKPSRYGFLVQTGNGKQYMPWIHIRDLCNIYIKAIKDQEMSGPYNAAAPSYVTHRQFMETLSLVVKRKVLPVPVPAYMLRIALGEMSALVLEGSRVSSDRLQKQNFSFLYGNLKEALENVLND